ncbi:hypothetical protein Esti_006594 [Eimeria stiedai]
MSLPGVCFALLSGAFLSPRSLGSLLRRPPLSGPPLAQLPPSPQAFSLSGCPRVQRTLQRDPNPQAARPHHLEWGGAPLGPLGGPRGPLPPTMFCRPLFAEPVRTLEFFSLCMQNVAEPPVAGWGGPSPPRVWGPMGAPHFLIPEVAGPLIAFGLEALLPLPPH